MPRVLLFLAALVLQCSAYAETAIPFDKLPLALAQKTVKGNGQRKLAYFTDPYCDYCQKLESELDSLDDVTLYRFLYPALPGSGEVVRSVLCAKNPDKAWKDWMQERVLPPPGACATETQKVLALGKRLKINGTPTLVFSNGSVVAGYQSSESIELMMLAADSK